MRKTLAAFILVVATIPAAAEAPIVASFDKTLDVPFRKMVMESMLAAAQRETGTAIPVREVADDPVQHLRNVEAAIAAKAKVVITTVSDGDVAQRIATLAASSDTALVFVNVRHALRPPVGRISMVSSNDLVAGRIQMRMIAEKLGGRGTVAILRGTDADGAAKERRAGMQEILAAYPNVSLVAEASANFLRGEGKKVVEGWLREGRRFDAIAAANDEMALGAVAALREAGLAGKVAVGGVDGTKEAVAAIKAGEMICSAFQNASGQGIESVANAVKLSRGEYAQMYDWVPYELIVSKNADSYMQR